MLTVGAAMPGGFSLDPANYIRTESASGRPIRFNWLATPTAGGFVSGYRWMLDGNIGDDSSHASTPGCAW